MTRAAIFAAVRAARGKGFTDEEVPILDAALDRLQVPRDDASIVLKPSRKALELIKSFESCRLEAYPDPGTGGDPWTIGWGATGAGIRKGVVWTQEQADKRFAEDVALFAAGVEKAIRDGAPTSQNEFDAMVSFAFNVGLGALRDSTLLQLHLAGDKAGAAKQFARWNRAGGKVLAGLTRRRLAEAALYRGEA